MTGYIKRLRFYLILIITLVPFLSMSSYSTLHASEELMLTLGEQKTIAAPDTLRIAIGDPGIADVKAIENSNKILITGMGVGKTNLIIWDKQNQERTILIQVFARDPEEVAQEIRELLHGVEGIEVKASKTRVLIEGKALKREDLNKITTIAALYPQVTNLVTLSPAVLDVVTKNINEEFLKAGLTEIKAERLGNHVIINGDVPNEESKNKAIMITSAFVDNPKININVGITLEKMVIINVDFIELDNSDSKNLGIKWDKVLNVAADVSGGGALKYGSKFTSTPFDGAYGLSTSYKTAINLIKSNSKSRILAQPKLVCRSGESAQFLAGGEIAIPISTMMTSSVEYKEYGLMLDISPVVDKNNNIATNIKVENSSITDSESGYPNFQSNRVQTSINVQSGETIVLTDLIQNRNAKAVEKVPVLGEVPILGELFKSRAFQNRETELVIFVTPEVILPDSQKNVDMIEDINKKYKESEKGLGLSIMD